MDEIRKKWKVSFKEVLEKDLINVLIDLIGDYYFHGPIIEIKSVFNFNNSSYLSKIYSDGELKDSFTIYPYNYQYSVHSKLFDYFGNMVTEREHWSTNPQNSLEIVHNNFLMFSFFNTIFSLFPIRLDEKIMNVMNVKIIPMNCMSLDNEIIGLDTANWKIVKYFPLSDEWMEIMDLKNMKTLKSQQDTVKIVGFDANYIAIKKSFSISILDRKNGFSIWSFYLKNFDILSSVIFLEDGILTKNVSFEYPERQKLEKQPSEEIMMRPFEQDPLKRYFKEYIISITNWNGYLLVSTNTNDVSTDVRSTEASMSTFISNQIFTDLESINHLSFTLITKPETIKNYPRLISLTG